MTTFLEGSVVLVTGASRGIGRALALRFASEGAHVIALARSIPGLESLDDLINKLAGSCTLVPLDITDGSGIDRLAESLFHRYGRVDVVIGNAAQLGVLGPIGHVSPNTWDRVIQVNLTANWRLVRSFDPLLRAATHGRAIFLTSQVGHAVSPYWGTYSVSKAGLEMLVRLYAAETKGTSVLVNLVDPGSIHTDMRSKAIPGEDKSKLPSPDMITDLFVDLCSPDCTSHGALLTPEVQLGRLSL